MSEKVNDTVLSMLTEECTEALDETMKLVRVVANESMTPLQRQAAVNLLEKVLRNKLPRKCTWSSAVITEKCSVSVKSVEQLLEKLVKDVKAQVEAEPAPYFWDIPESPVPDDILAVHRAIPKMLTECGQEDMIVLYRQLTPEKCVKYSLKRINMIVSMFQRINAQSMAFNNGESIFGPDFNPFSYFDSGSGESFWFMGIREMCGMDMDHEQLISEAKAILNREVDLGRYLELLETIENTVPEGVLEFLQKYQIRVPMTQADILNVNKISDNLGNIDDFLRNLINA